MRHRARPERVAFLSGAIALCLVSVACAPNDTSSSSPTPTSSSGTSAADACANPQTIEPGVLTIATDSPAYDPWFSDDDPTNGKGFESAVAYAVAKGMGFAKDADWLALRQLRREQAG